MDMSQVVITLDRYANTSAATIPIALDEAVRDGRIKREQLLLLEAFGGGWTWGSALVRFKLNKNYSNLHRTYLYNSEKCGHFSTLISKGKQ